MLGFVSFKWHIIWGDKKQHLTVKFSLHRGVVQLKYRVTACRQRYNNYSINYRYIIGKLLFVINLIEQVLTIFGIQYVTFEYLLKYQLHSTFLLNFWPKFLLKFLRKCDRGLAVYTFFFSNSFLNLFYSYDVK